jgi:hypothetical protein
MQNGNLIMKAYLFAAAGLAIALPGCEVPELDTPQASVSSQPTHSASGEAAAEPSRLEQAAHVDPASFLPDGRVDMSGVPDEPPMTTGVPREVDPKDPKKGKLTRKSGGALGTSMKALPWVENKTKFDMIKYNLTIFEADKSRWPKSHKEFMEVFLPQYYPAALPLPELEPGDEYIYDPDDHLLKIWRPTEATPEMRAKYLGEGPAANEQAPIVEETGQSPEPVGATGEDPTIRGRAEGLQNQIDQGQPPTEP